MKELFAFKIVPPVCQTGLRLLKVLVRLGNHLRVRGVLLPGAPDRASIINLS